MGDVRDGAGEDFQGEDLATVHDDVDSQDERASLERDAANLLAGLLGNDDAEAVPDPGVVRTLKAGEQRAIRTRVHNADVVLLPTRKELEVFDSFRAGEVDKERGGGHGVTRLPS